MLESGAIRPSQSAWCNTVALVRKKDGLLPQIQEVLESLVGTGHFSCLDLKSGFWQIRMDEVSKQYTAFTVGNLGFFECDRMPFGTLQCAGYFPMAYAELYG